ncbi:DUF2937 family protein [Psychromarinibacter halotolerans]|uniref:DUF2937 family protein n=1 Tax=Psychromarinibacter halotolerans TaxID=1775175 RepID=A0ABV7GXS8_9RHOB|nr:DUF2937 family protein [Psychromarinibacter halotolerans]MDF0598025.1 DUF2937 family protein [Psychromarinibacter halotolerans]
MLKILTLAGGVAGAVALSQFPEFSQQYLQRLSGAVDELRTQVVAFDTLATAAGITREEALAELDGSTFQSGLQAHFGEQVHRYERLSADYTALRQAEPLQRLAQFWRFDDPDLAQRTWDDFRPAVPVTTDGLICAGIGFAGGWLALTLLFGLLMRPFRRFA